MPKLRIGNSGAPVVGDFDGDLLAWNAALQEWRSVRGAPPEIHYVRTLDDLPDPVDRERILTDGLWIFLGNIIEGGDPALGNSLVIPAGGRVGLLSGQISFDGLVRWGYATTSDKPALRIAQSGKYALPFFVRNLNVAVPSVETDANTDVTIANWQVGEFSTGPGLFRGSIQLLGCDFSAGIEFAGGAFAVVNGCRHAGLSLSGVGPLDHQWVRIEGSRMHAGTAAPLLTIPDGVGIAGGGVIMTDCQMAPGSPARLLASGSGFNKAGSPYLKLTNLRGGSPSLGVVPAGGVRIAGFSRQTADGGFVGFTEGTAKVYVRESWAEDGTKLPETAI